MNLKKNSGEEKNEIPLKVLKKFSKMIDDGATGFELAFETEVNNLTNLLMNNGIFFYHTFLNIGDQVFKKAPDKKKTNYQSFKLIENTEKYIFLEWLEKQIAQKDHKKNMMKEYSKFVESKEYKYKEHFICKNCGAKITNKKQKFCEECGMELIL